MSAHVSLSAVSRSARLSCLSVHVVRSVGSLLRVCNARVSTVPSGISKVDGLFEVRCHAVVTASAALRAVVDG